MSKTHLINVTSDFMMSKWGMIYSRSNTKLTLYLILSQETLSSRSSMTFINIDEDESEQNNDNDIFKTTINFLLSN